MTEISKGNLNYQENNQERMEAATRFFFSTQAIKYHQIHVQKVLSFILYDFLTSLVRWFPNP